MKIGCTCKRNHPGVNHYKFSSVISCLPNVMGEGWKGFTDIGPCDQNDFCMFEISPGIGGAIQAKGFFISSSSAHHTQPSVVIKIGSFEGYTSELPDHITFFIGQGDTR